MNIATRVLVVLFAVSWSWGCKWSGANPSAPRPCSREAVRLALERNPDLASAQQRLAAARAALRQADAAFYPHVRVSESYAASDNPVQAFMMTLNQRAFNFNADFNHPDNTDNLNTKLLATYPLYNGGSDLAARQAARLGAEARANSTDAVRNELVFEVTRSFYTIGKARRFVARRKRRLPAWNPISTSPAIASHRAQCSRAICSMPMSAWQKRVRTWFWLAMPWQFRKASSATFSASARRERDGRRGAVQSSRKTP